MSNVIIGISEMAISNQPDDVLVTYSLGSCLGGVFYDPVMRVGGMIHCMLPLSSIDVEKARVSPCMFVDTGVSKLLTELFALGCQKRNVITRLAGAANVLDNKRLFRIGERNYAVCRKILWKNSLLITAEDIGGQISRTIRLNIGTGEMTIKSSDREYAL
jgi:chemotaxis protein CheD